MSEPRLDSQLAFIREIDRLKTVFRQTYLLDASRKENDAEHAWQLGMMAMVLAEHAADTPDLSKVIQMVLVHDLVEIDAGDTYAYDQPGHADKARREQQAADRIFALLPDDQARQMRSLWDEFEAGQSPEARFANALDRLQPLLHNVLTGGKAWQEHGTRAPEVLQRNARVADGSPRLGRLVESLVAEAVEKGYLAP